MKAHSIARFARIFACAGVLHVSAAGAATETVIYRFKGIEQNDGFVPVAGLLNIRGTLYGTTEAGGAYYQSGTVFSVTPGGTEKVIYPFEAGSDGAFPLTGLINVNGTLYGTTSASGMTCDQYGNTCGTIFSITPGGTETVLHVFEGGKDGGVPYAGLTDMYGTLYGTTATYGAYGGGTVFSVTRTGTEKVLHAFKGGSDGEDPRGLIAVNGTLYGTTSDGGAYQSGTVFSITPGGTEKVLYSFKGGSDGASPGAGLINVNGTLYGTTEGGGGARCGCGTVFSITLSGTEKVIHGFKKGRDGANPFGSLLAVNGALYGTAYSGGAYRSGTVFRVTTDGTWRVLYKFKGGSDGAFPFSGLIHVRGAFYGTTSAGGIEDYGTVFSITP